MESMVDLLTSTFLREVSRRLFPKLGSDCDSHHTFNVRYRPDEDRGLDMHTDDSDVTFNVCLGKEFEGAGLQFCGTMKKARHRKASAQVRHALGRCLVHLGQLRHGADDIIAGERQNLIIWMRNSQWRKTEEYEAGAFETEAEPPDPVCLSYTHDRDYGQYKPFNDKTKAFKGTGWCPPDRYAYKGFVPDKPE
ncbi:putative PKHD-type hydroxylase [Diplonema papillatum]|nr:putative PKHD-type hydroxylase [Diplonema papillatum]